jgi:hypothetical protein
MSTVKFAFVVDGDFGGAMEVTEAHPNYELLCAVMRSEPVIIEIPESHPQFGEIKIGWTYHEGNWIEPTE